MAHLGKEIWIKTEDKPGTLVKVSASIKEAGANIEALTAWREKGTAIFFIVTDNNQGAIENLTKVGLSCEEKDVILFDLANQVGSLAETSQKLAGAGVDINYIYVTASGSQCSCVLSTKDNTKALSVLG